MERLLNGKTCQRMKNFPLNLFVLETFLMSVCKVRKFFSLYKIIIKKGVGGQKTGVCVSQDEVRTKDRSVSKPMTTREYFIP